MKTTMLVDNPSLIVAGIFLAFVLLESVCSSFRQPAGSRRDVLIEVIGSGLLVTVTFPLVMASSGAILEHLLPDMKNALQALPWLAGFALFLLFDDMTQYGWHRLAHKVPALYALHRAHHSAAYMSVRIVYRNNSFYYLLMPGLWLSGALIYLGLAPVYYVYLIVKMTVIFAAHSSVAWDEKLYGIPAMRPLVWILERTISTPSTHSAHHGLTAEDGITHYKGNFGNLLFFWDVLFGTAKITRRRPPAYGIEHLRPVNWTEELFWPVVRTRRLKAGKNAAQNVRTTAQTPPPAVAPSPPPAPPVAAGTGASPD